MEEWCSLEVVDCPGYQVSTLGRVRNSKSGQLMSQHFTDAGYRAAGVYNSNGKCKVHLVHRLVAQAFLKQPDGKGLVHHINHDRGDARLANLAWVDHSTNNRDRTETLTVVKATKDVPQALPGEIWKAVSTLPSAYPVSVSNLGRVRHGITATPVYGTETGKDGYRRVKITMASGTKKQTSVHRLVAGAFCPCPDPAKTVVNHISGNKGDNRAGNLEWTTHAQNSQHAYDRPDSKRRRVRAIEQYDLAGNKVGEYPSLAKASQAIGKVGHNLGDACNGKQRTAGGYTWKYKE